MTETLQRCGVAVFRTRFVDGWDTVKMCPGGTFLWESGDSNEQREYATARQLLIAVTGHPKARNWTFDRYFRTGRYTPPSSVWTATEPTLLDLFVVSDSFEPVTVTPDTHQISVAGSPALALSSDFTHPGLDTPRACSSVVLGIDLQRRGGEVAKLFFAGFGKSVMAAGYDPKDVLQEVYKGLLVRNKGRCPFDPRKASFGHYVHMVCQCIVSNYFRSQGRLSRWNFDDDVPLEQIGTLESQDDPWTDLQQEIKGSHRQARVARLLLPLVRQGLDRTEMAERLGIGKAVVSRALRFLRQQARSLS